MIQSGYAIGFKNITVKVECNKMLNRELEFSMSITTMVINAGFSAECMTTLSIIGSTIIIVSRFLFFI